MARNVRIILVDDLDGTELPQDQAQTVTFAFQGTEYEIDLSDKNAKAFEKAMDKYLQAARKVGKVSKARSGNRGNLSVVRDGSKPDPKAVRAWAETQGIEVPSRGRIPNEVVEKFQAAQAV